ncbi:MAG: hypothetical protein EBS06_03805 [Proteobacteria bacterium]|nr:hypothetical protein [Pseudomonadota bacterium]
MKQLILNLKIAENKNSYSAENFVTLAENSAAKNLLEQFFKQKEFPQAQFKSLILKGAKASGKTHLLNIFAKQDSVNFLEITKITKQNLVKFLKKNQFYILENIHEIKNEELLLHLINSVSEAKSFLILSCENKQDFALKDLTSRLKNIFTTEIKNPNLETIKMLLINAFSRRQIKVSDHIVDFIANNISRSYEAIFKAAELIEKYCNESGKNITLQTVTRIICDSKI